MHYLRESRPRFKEDYSAESTLMQVIDMTTIAICLAKEKETKRNKKKKKKKHKKRKKEKKKKRKKHGQYAQLSCSC
jgi:hypothetical protein